MIVMVQNVSGMDLRGPYFIVAPGDIFEAPIKWVRARDDSFRRGYFEVVSGVEVVADVDDFSAPFFGVDEEE